jgi:hypothetical protein
MATRPAALLPCSLILTLALAGCGSSEGDSSATTAATEEVGEEATDASTDETRSDETGSGETGSDETGSDETGSGDGDTPTEAGLEEALTVVGITATSITVDESGWVIDIPADQGDPADYAESTCVNARLYISATDPDGSSGVASEVEVTVDGELAFTWSGDFADQCAAE